VVKHRTVELNRHAFCARKHVDETVSWKPV